MVAGTGGSAVSAHIEDSSTLPRGGWWRRSHGSGFGEAESFVGHFVASSAETVVFGIRESGTLLIAEAGIVGQTRVEFFQFFSCVLRCGLLLGLSCFCHLLRSDFSRRQTFFSVAAVSFGTFASERALLVFAFGAIGTVVEFEYAFIDVGAVVDAVALVSIDAFTLSG